MNRNTVNAFRMTSCHFIFRGGFFFDRWRRFVVHAGGIENKTIAARSVEVTTLLRSSHLVLDAEYYIEKKIIPPLARIFNLVGANVEQWYREVPKYKYRPLRAQRQQTRDNDNERKAVAPRTMDSWVNTTESTTVCALCGSDTPRGQSENPRPPKHSL